MRGYQVFTDQPRYKEDARIKIGYDPDFIIKEAIEHRKFPEHKERVERALFERNIISDIVKVLA